MNYKITSLLIVTCFPAAVAAQELNLLSDDGYIDVTGDIVGYNGTMVQVDTVVGVVAVPASEVICIGQTCAEVIANNDFGLTENSFQAIQLAPADAETAQSATDPAPAAPTDSSQPAADSLTVSFAWPDYQALFRTIAGGFAVANISATVAELTDAGGLELANMDLSQTARLSPVAPPARGDIIIQSEPLTVPAEARYPESQGWAGDQPISHQMLGLRGFAVLVAPSAGISSISLDDLARIYAGDVTNYSQIGGADLAILPLQLPPESRIGEAVQRLVMAPQGLTLAQDILTIAEETGLVGAINQFPGSIAIVGHAFGAEDTTVAVRGSCGIATRPTDFNISSGDYPLISPIMARYDTPPTTTLIAEMFDFAASDVNQTLLSDEGLIDYSSRLQDNAEKNARLSALLNSDFDTAQRPAAASMFEALLPAERLSTTFRGGTLSGPEGAWNRAMLIDLIQALRTDQYSGSDIVLAGFAQSAEDSQAAFEVSSRAADQMLAELQRAMADVISDQNLGLSAQGFGDIAVPTCITGQVQGAPHARVEVWVKPASQ